MSYSLFKVYIQIELQRAQLACNICFRNNLFDQLMEKSSGVGSFTRRVVLLKDSDCVKHDGKIFMPTTIDMAKIKKPHTGQYNKEVLFSKSMSEEVVRQTLQKAFPSFNLTGR